MTTCEVDGCDRPTRSGSNPLCNAHYLRRRKYGRLAPLPAYDTCQIDGCPTPPRSARLGLCERHYYRIRRGGTTDLRHVPTGRATTSNGYALVRRPGHPLARRRGNPGWVLEHRVVLYDAIGPGAHPCHWCGDPVDWERSYPRDLDGLVVDHLDGDKTNNDPANLVPACNLCNTGRTAATTPGGWNTPRRT